MLLHNSAYLLVILATALAIDINEYDQDHGVFIGELSNLANAGISGQVYLVNISTIQIFNFTFNGQDPDVYFWLDAKEAPTSDGVKVPTFEYGITPLARYNTPERVVLNVPKSHNITEFKSLSLFSFKNEHNFGSVSIPENLNVPKIQRFIGDLKGARYRLLSGPIYAVDRRTIKVYGFTFQGDRAPDTFFSVGRGSSVAFDTGVRVAIRGKDVDKITQMTENYSGGKDIYLELPEEYDINHIDWLSVYCYKYRVDFGHVTVPTNISSVHIPPYVPVQNRSEDLEPTPGAWPRAALLGNDARRNLTFQIGNAGGDKGLKAYTHMRTPANVWYVNGLMAPDLYLKRNTSYNFFIEGGRDKGSSDFFNPLYVSEDKEGGYDKLSNDEIRRVKLHSEGEANQHAGPLCGWFNDDINANDFDTFEEFRKQLNLHCDEDGGRYIITFTSNENTPSVLYYNSASNFNMGGRIFIVDEMPQNIADIIEEPFTYDEWIKTRETQQEMVASASSAFVAFTVLLSAVFFF